MPDHVTDTLGELGEKHLIAHIRTWLGEVSPPSPAGIGDDCAVLPRSRGRTLITVDPVIRGKHFNDTMPPAAVAAKVLKRNLSDIAAMGGVPRHAVIALAAPPDLPVAWLRAFYRGIARLSRKHGVRIVGGDCAQTENFLGAFLTLTGDAPARPLTRDGAKPGDLLFVSGTLGGSILGKHWRFEPRLAEGQWLAARRNVRAAMDVSDGIGKDLFSLVPAGACAVLDQRAMPVSAAAKRLARKSARHLLDHALNDGEDYELLFAVAPSAGEALARAWRARFTTRLTCIGRFEKRTAGEPVLRFEPPLPDGVQARGYEHFR